MSYIQLEISSLRETPQSVLYFITRGDDERKALIDDVRLGTIDLHPFRFIVISFRTLTSYEDNTELHEVVAQQEITL